MAEKNPPLYLQQRTDHTAEGDRALLSTLFYTEGITASGSLAVAQSGTPGMSVQVAAGTAVVQGDDNSLQGLYHVWNDAAATLVISAADATNPRRDIIVARVRDAYYTGATNAFALEVITGTPAAGPADPTIPNNCLSLARVAVAALASSITNANITNLRPITRPWNSAWGRVGSATASSNQTPITTATDATGLSVTFTAVAGRLYEAKSYGLFSSDAASTVIRLDISDSSNNVLRRGSTHVAVASSGIGCLTQVTLAGLSGSTTIKCRTSRQSGAGVVTLANATDNGSLEIFDVGPA
jgi:hypothetical protein